MTKISLVQRLAELAAQSVKTASSQAIAIGEAVMSGEYELVRVSDAPKVELPSTEAEVERVLEAILTVGAQRGLLLDLLRAALIAGEQASALGLARELVGLGEGEEPRETVH